MKFCAVSVDDLIGRGSRPARGAWVEIQFREYHDTAKKSSRPARGAWVEILRHRPPDPHDAVAPRKGRVG